MPLYRGIAFALAAAMTSVFAPQILAQDQTAADAANELAMMLDSANELDGENVITALQGAADAGQPMAMWQLGLMYESGVGVEQDQARAFRYFSEIANQHADASPRSLDADIVAQSFLKVGEYYRHGLPDAGIPVDNSRARALLLHAASYFGDAEAQFKVGEMYLDPDELGVDPLQSARWLSLAARKGHVGAQARLGELLYKGRADLDPQPVEGLMWLSLAQRNAGAGADDAWIRDLTGSALSKAPDAQLEAAQVAADALASQFAAAY